MNPLIWLFVFVFNALGAWVNKLNNDNPKWFWAACIISICPVFPFISRYTKNLLIDGLIYDVVIFFAYLIVLLLLGCGKNLTTLQWVGFVLTIIGCILMKARL